MLSLQPNKTGALLGWGEGSELTTRDAYAGKE